MDQIDMFGFCQAQSVTRMAEYHNPHIEPDDRVRNWRYAQAAFGAGPAGSPRRIETLHKQVGRVHEFVIVPSEFFRAKLVQNMGEPRDADDQTYLTNLYTHTETVGAFVRDFLEYEQDMSLVGCMPLFTAATIYEIRLVMFWHLNKLETVDDWTAWLKAVDDYIDQEKCFEIHSSTELYSK